MQSFMHFYCKRLLWSETWIGIWEWLNIPLG